MKTRVITAIVMIAIIVPFIYLGGYPFAFFAGIVGILAYKEVLDLKTSHNEYPAIVKVLGLLSLIYLMVGDYDNSSFIVRIDYSRLVLPIILLLVPIIFYKNNKYNSKDAFYLLGFIYTLGLFFNLMITIRNNSIFLFLYLLSVPIFTDTLAYLVGSLIGHHKMSPVISPKKSWEGAVGGLIGGTIIGLIFYSNLIGKTGFKIIIITMLLSIIGQIGDLVFSKIKRENEIKDFSNIMPGHGGILDRLDSIFFAVLFYMLIISFI